MTSYQLFALIAGLFCAGIVGFGIWSTRRNHQANPLPAPAGLLTTAAPAPRLTFGKVVLAVIAGNLVTAIAAALIYLLITAK
jgi:hypothetical protein